MTLNLSAISTNAQALGSSYHSKGSNTAYKVSLVFIYTLNFPPFSL